MGGGLGWYENGSAMVYKRSLSAKEDPQFPEFSKEVRSEIIIAHVRRGTRGKVSRENSHPFEYKNWIFAHNGSVDREYLYELLSDKYRKSIKGETDSEVYFYWILQCIEECGGVLDGIRMAVKEVIKSSYRGLNFLLSDGAHLYAFRYSDYSRGYYSLYLLKRVSTSYGPFDVVSKETKALLRSKSLKGEKAILVCSEKLTEENWEEIKVGSLITVDQNLDIRVDQIL